MDRQEVVMIISIVDFALAVITILHETLALIFGSRSSFKVKMLSSPHSDNLTFINHGLGHRVTSSSSDTAESLAFVLIVFVVYGIFITQLVMAAKLFLASKKMRSLGALKRVILFSCWRIWSCVFLFLLFGLLTVSIVMSVFPPPSSLSSASSSSSTSFQPSPYSNSNSNFFHKYNVELNHKTSNSDSVSGIENTINNNNINHHDDDTTSTSTTRIKWSHWLLWSILSIQIIFRIFAIVFIGMLKGKLKNCLVHPAFAMPSPRPSLHPQAIDIQIQIPKKHLSASASATTTPTPTPTSISTSPSTSTNTSCSELRTPTRQIILPSTLPCSTPLRPLYHNYKL